MATGEKPKERSIVERQAPPPPTDGEYTITEEDVRLFDDIYERHRDAIDQHLESCLEEHGSEGRLRKLLAHAVRDGKRTRAMLSWTVAIVYGLPRDRALDLCAIVEFIHNATLVADDYVDNTIVRRNVPTLWRVVERLPFIGPDELNCRTFTVLAENGVLTVALQIPRNPDVVSAMGDAVQAAFEGFYNEARPSGYGGDAYTDYIEVNRQKTGSLFELASRLPAIVSDHSPAIETAARKYGQRVGILYQITDDICDGDLPEFIGDPEAELQRWHGLAVDAIDELSVSSWEERWLLATVPVWCVYRMLEQEDRTDVFPEFTCSATEEGDSDADLEGI